MFHGSKEKNVLGGNAISQVDRFKYLGSMVRIDVDFTPEICVRLLEMLPCSSQLIGLWKVKEISLKLKMQPVKSLVWCIALYGTDSWSLRQTYMRRIESFEL